MSDNIQEAEVGSGTKISDTKQSEKRAQITLKAIQLRLKQEKERAALQAQKKSLSVKEDIGESFSPSQIAALKAEYSKINTVDPDGDTYKKLIAMLDRLDLKSLKSLAGAEIKFVSKLAQNRVLRKSMKKEDVQLDEISTKLLAKAAHAASDPDADYYYGKSHDPQKFADRAKKTKDAKSAAAVQGAADAKGHYTRPGHTIGSYDKLAHRSPARVTSAGKANKQDVNKLKKSISLKVEEVESIDEQHSVLYKMKKSDPKIAVAHYKSKDDADKFLASVKEKGGNGVVRVGKIGLDLTSTNKKINELSNDKLADYKKKAGEDASKADKEGDTKKGNKRFSGIMKATKKQFDNDAKGEKNESVTEASQRVDSLVTDALKIMKGSELKDAVQALKTVLGDREYNDRRGHYNFYIKQLVDMYGKKANEELDIELDEVLSKDSTAGDFIHDFVNSDNPKFAGKSKEKRKQMALAAYYAKQKNEELSPKQKEIDKNKNGKIDGFDLAHLRKKTEELSPKQKALDKNKNGKIDGSDLAKLRKEEVDLQEKSDYEVYHKDYSGAVQTAIKQAEKRGFEVDMDDWHDKVATGPKKPSAGKTNSFSVKLKKDGKESKKALHLQVYNMDNHKYELNMYIESVEEAASPAQQAAIAIAMKKAGKTPKDMEESDAYDKDVKPSDKPHDKEAAAKRAKLAALAARKKMSEGLMNKIKAMKRGAEAKAKADDHFDKAGDPKNANASKDLKKAVRYNNLLNKEGAGPDLNPVAKHVTKGELKKSGISKWLAVSEEEKVPEFKSGGPELAKKFNKAFKSMGVDANVKIKTVGNISTNEEVVTEAKKPKSFKDVKKKMKEEEKPNKASVQKGDDLTGKKEPIEVNPEIKESKNNE